VNGNLSPLDQIIRVASAPGVAGGGNPMAGASVGKAKSDVASFSRRDFTVITFALVFVAVMGLLYLVQSAQITSTAYSVHDLQARLERLQQENLVLSMEAAQNEGLDRVQARAAALGMERAKNVAFVQMSSTAAPLRVGLSELTPVAPANDAAAPAGR
jgi:cell division protein FtsL